MINPNGILLLSIDSLRDDHFNSEHFPCIWKYLENDFTIFEEVYSHGVATPFAFPGLISGEPVSGDGSLPPHPTVAEVNSQISVARTNNDHLREERGYNRGFDNFSIMDTNANTENDSLLEIYNDLVSVGSNIYQRYPIPVLKSLNDKFSSYIEELTYRLGNDVIPLPYMSAESLVDLITEDLSKLSEFGLYWSHFMDPHYPFHPSYSTDRIDTNLSQLEIKELNEASLNKLPDEDDVKLLESIYSENIRYMDSHIEELFSFLRKNDMYDKLCIIITSDHGELFGEHGKMGHPWDCEPFNELINVPLAVKLPTSVDQPEKTQNSLSHSNIYRFLIEYSKSGVFKNNLLTKQQDFVISKSNTHIRITWEGGSYVSDFPITELPERVPVDLSDINHQECNVPKLSGHIPGGNTDEVNERLKALGYK